MQVESLLMEWELDYHPRQKGYEGLGNFTVLEQNWVFWQ